MDGAMGRWMMKRMMDGRDKLSVVVFSFPTSLTTLFPSRHFYKFSVYSSVIDSVVGVYIH